MGQDWKPNLFVPGFPKCGTTALCDYLKQNPEVYVMSPKEPNTLAIGIDLPAWARDHHQLKRPYFTYLDMDQYRGQLERRGGFRFRVDGSQSYIWPPEFPQRLWRFAPGAKLLFMIREQKERLLSLYFHGFTYHLEADFGRWIERRFRPQARPFFFKEMLTSYHQLFGDAVRVVDNGSLSDRPTQVMREVFEFLGVGEAEVEPLRSNMGKLKSLDEGERRTAAPYLRLTRTVMAPAKYFLNLADPEGKAPLRKALGELNPLRRIGGYQTSPGKARGPATGGAAATGKIPADLASQLDDDYAATLEYCRAEHLLLGAGG
ncbi:MAG: hypothetical protein JRN44_00275 [Nitrososphaerota archaeon]|jgi:hypothetical protein|nr:hypothetical protein [Nitrososphaerota archaeon]MDG6941885.1 hypothetical protein [Nitrososphaerota archaeon]MDG6946942.1 hypothetical protein [Nitrososphaerota archaeon]MDG6950647.1 hypothetical protein [Nitrososphaerota archaeon]